MVSLNSKLGKLWFSSSVKKGSNALTTISYWASLTSHLTTISWFMLSISISKGLEPFCNTGGLVE